MQSMTYTDGTYADIISRCVVMPTYSHYPLLPMGPNNNNNMQILIKPIKHPTDTPMRCCLLLRYQEYCHNHFAPPRMCYWPSAHPIST